MGAGIAPTTHHIGAHGDPIAYSEPTAVELNAFGGCARDLGDHSNVLVALDDRERCVGLSRRTGVLLSLAQKRVLVGAADAGHLDLHEQRPVGQGGSAELLHLIATWRH